MSSRDGHTTQRSSSTPRADDDTMDAGRWIGRIIDGRYRIDSYLDEGAMGFVFAGEHVGLRRPVAVKILRRSLTKRSAFLASFEREARAEASAGSPHIVEVYDFGVADGEVAYVVMELLEGRTLEALLEEGPVPWPRAREIALQICHGLSAAHRAGVVHRDIKPANLFLVRDERAPSGETIKILDFGLAELRDEAKGSTFGAGWVGTPAYMSPEQCLSLEVDARSDLYSVGVILYEMLSGTLPFDGDDVGSVVFDHLHTKPPPLRVPGSPSALSDELGSIVERALAKSPDLRFESMNELEEALLRADRAARVTNVAPSIPPVASPPPRRLWPAAVALLVFTGGALALGAAWPRVEAEATLAAKVVQPPEVFVLPAAPAASALDEVEAPPDAEPIELRSSPPRAAVRQAGIHVGLTPLRVSRPGPGEALELTVSRRGFIHQHVRLTEDGPSRILVRLDPRRDGWSPGRASRLSPPAPSHRGHAPAAAPNVPPNPFAN